MADHGAPQSYLTLERGTPVLAAGGEPVGAVERVLAAGGEGIFDGIVVATEAGRRFVDAPEVGAIYERAVVLTITADEASALPEPTANPAVMTVGARDLRRGLGDRLRRFLGR